MTSLYERLGGKDALKMAVAKFYSRILTDKDLTHFFAPERVDVLKRSQQAFMTMAFGGPHAYTGPSLRDAHARLVEKGLSDKHFDLVAEHLASVLTEMKVAPDLIEEVLGVVETTRNDVLCR